MDGEFADGNMLSDSGEAEEEESIWESLSWSFIAAGIAGDRGRKAKGETFKPRSVKTKICEVDYYGRSKIQGQAVTEVPSSYPYILLIDTKRYVGLSET